MNNIYTKLAELPPEIADKITNAKTNGGRALDAIYNLEGVTGSQKTILTFIGSRMSYSGENFTGQYQYISLTDMAKKTSLSRRTIIRAINGHVDLKNPSKNYQGLTSLGYLIKKCASKYEQINLKHANMYALTPKIFNEYMHKLADEAIKKIKEVESLKFCENEENEIIQIYEEEFSELVTPCHQASDMVSLGWCHRDTGVVTLSTSSSVLPSVLPSAISSIDAVQKNKISETIKNEKVKTTAAKKQSKVLTFRSKPKISFKNAKGWSDNKEEEKLDILLGLACNGHRRAVDLKECPPFDFLKFPTILKPFFDKYPLDLLYQFYSYAEKVCASIDVFKSEETLHRWQKMIERERGALNNL